MATLLEGGHVIDPIQHIDDVLDVLIEGDKIKAVGKNLRPQTLSEDDIVDCRGKLVLPGLIDTHGHIYQGVTGRFGLNPDLCGVHSGVTTLVDQGGPSCITLPGFKQFIVKPSKTRVLAFLSAYLVGGLEGHFYPELYRPECVDVDATVKSANSNLDVVKGFKAHAEIGGFERWGIEVMRLAAQIGQKANLPLYIHFGQLWPKPKQNGLVIDPDCIFSEVLSLLKPGDILSHPFSRHPGGFVETNGKVHPLVPEAIQRGLKVDVGHGSHFSLQTARIVLDAGVIPDTLGADMHGYNTRVPVPAGTPESHPDEGHIFKGMERFSLVSAMTTMLALGLPLQHVVAMVTKNAAEMVGMADTIGSLTPGHVADVSVLNDERGHWIIRDNEKTEITTDRQLTPAFCYRAGEYFKADANILPELQAA